MPELFTDQLARVQRMASGTGQDAALSLEGQAALRAVLDVHAATQAELADILRLMDNFAKMWDTDRTEVIGDVSMCREVRDRLRNLVERKDCAE